MQTFRAQNVSFAVDASAGVVTSVRLRKRGPD